MICEKVDQKNIWKFQPHPSRHMRRKISAHVDGGLSGESRVRRPGSEQSDNFTSWAAHRS